VILYDKLQTFTAQNFNAKTDGNHGRILVSVKMAVREGMDAEFDEWYRKQHLDMLSMVKGYRRTTKWKVNPVRPAAEGTPEYLALHEFEAKPPMEQMEVVVGTEWSRKVIGEARAFVRDVWELVDVQGGGEEL